MARSRNSIAAKHSDAQLLPTPRRVTPDQIARISGVEIVRMKLSDLVPAPFNPRVPLKPGDPGFESIRRSFLEFGSAQLLVVDKSTRFVVAGNQRLAVMKECGVEEVEAIVVDLPLEKVKALCVRLNVNDGQWELNQLAQLFDELQQLPSFDATITGFNSEDIGAIIAEQLLGSDRDEEFDVEAELEREGPAITQPGELIELGRHRLLCGDSADANAYGRLLNDEKVNLIFTDPPYNVRYLGGERPNPSRARPKRSRAWTRIYNDNLSQEEYRQWLSGILNLAIAKLLPGCAFYVWNGFRQFGFMYTLLEEIGLVVSNVIVWAKPTFAIGYGDYNQQCEYCLYGWRPCEGRKGGHAWFGPKNESTLWEINRDPTKNYIHPTQKPLELAERAIRNSTRAGEVVLDMFLGSGTSLLACEKLGRTARGVELDPRYCDCIVRRYISYVGEANAPRKLVERYRIEPTKARAAEASR